MAISETFVILAGGTAVLAIAFGIRLAIRAVADGGAAAARSGGGQASAAGESGGSDVAGVIALPPLIFLGFLAAAAVLEAVVPLAVLGAHAIPRYLAGAVLAAGGFVMILIGSRRFFGARPHNSPSPPPTTPVTHGIYRRTRNPPYFGKNTILLG